MQLDIRYTITRESIGVRELRYVVRFGCNVIGQSASHFDALAIAESHNNDRYS
jgi:hypothetical protein